jgi:hypothetical protein
VVKLNLPYYASRPYSASIPRFILICGIRFRNPRFFLICGIRVLSSLAKSVSAIRFRIPVSRFIPTRITAEFIQAVVFKTESPFRQTEDM